MKYSMIAVSALGLLCLAGVVAADEPAATPSETPQSTPQSAPQSTEGIELETNEEKVNYSLGFELGKDLKRQELKLVPDALLKGAEDAMAGGKPLVNTPQRQTALKEIRELRAQENLEKSQAFLTANAEKEGVQTLPSGLQYKELQAGEGKTPGPNASVVVNYRGTLIDGTEFDSSYERGKPATFQVKRVIKGWREALQLMKEGAKWEVFIPPELAYGKRGRGKIIPPNSALVFEVELLEVK